VRNLRKVSGLFPNALCNVSGFSLPPITDRHHITEKLLSMAKNSKNQSTQDPSDSSPRYYIRDSQSGLHIESRNSATPTDVASKPTGLRQSKYHSARTTFVNHVGLIFKWRGARTVV
jgi:hypothetical protein